MCLCPLNTHFQKANSALLHRAKVSSTYIVPPLLYFNIRTFRGNMTASLMPVECTYFNIHHTGSYAHKHCTCLTVKVSFLHCYWSSGLIVDCAFAGLYSSFHGSALAILKLPCAVLEMHVLWVLGAVELLPEEKKRNEKIRFSPSSPFPLGNFCCASAGKSLSLHDRWQWSPFCSSHPNHELANVCMCVGLFTRGWNMGMEGRKRVPSHPTRDCDKALSRQSVRLAPHLPCLSIHLPIAHKPTPSIQHHAFNNRLHCFSSVISTLEPLYSILQRQAGPEDNYDWKWDSPRMAEQQADALLALTCHELTSIKKMMGWFLVTKCHTHTHRIHGYQASII